MAPLERRPIASRDTAWARAISAWLARCGASPNGISVAGMLAALLAGGCLGLSAHVPEPWAAASLLAAALLILVRLLANMFDGMVALATGKTSPVGELFNEVPDRVSDAAILIGCGYAVGGQVELGYAAACLALFIAYLRAQGKVAGAHQEYCGPMAKQQRMTLTIAATIATVVLPETWQRELQQQTGLGLLAWALVGILAGGTVTVVRRWRKITASLHAQPVRPSSEQRGEA